MGSFGLAVGRAQSNWLCSEYQLELKPRHEAQPDVDRDPDIGEAYEDGIMAEKGSAGLHPGAAALGRPGELARID